MFDVCLRLAALAVFDSDGLTGTSAFRLAGRPICVFDGSDGFWKGPLGRATTDTIKN
jgi:hypothetical protein